MTFVNVPCTGLTSVHFIVESCQFIILGMIMKKIKKEYDVGTKLQIYNPCIRSPMSDPSIIRVDDLRSIKFIG